MSLLIKSIDLGKFSVIPDSPPRIERIHSLDQNVAAAADQQLKELLPSFQDLAIDQPVAALREDTLSLFRQNRLLARAMQQEITNDIELDFSSFKSELQLMKTAEKLRTASCTLLVAGHAVSTYKPYGFLFNAKTSEVVHAAPHDVNKKTNDQGDIIVAANEVAMTLEELENFIIETPPQNRQLMNEVNCNFSTADLSGLFVVDAPNKLPLIDILIVQSWMKKKHEIDLPLFIYEKTTGALTPFVRTEETMKELLSTFKSAKGKLFAQVIAPYLGLNIH